MIFFNRKLIAVQWCELGNECAKCEQTINYFSKAIDGDRISDLIKNIWRLK